LFVPNWNPFRTSDLDEASHIIPHFPDNAPLFADNVLTAFQAKRETAIAIGAMDDSTTYRPIIGGMMRGIDDH
jgi:hypothetical protein